VLVESVEKLKESAVVRADVDGDRVALGRVALPHGKPTRLRRIEPPKRGDPTLQRQDRVSGFLRARKREVGATGT